MADDSSTTATAALLAEKRDGNSASAARQRRSYLEATALTLLVYAERHPTFAGWFAAQLASVPLPASAEAFRSAEPSRHGGEAILLPRDDEAAQRRAGWLLERLRGGGAGAVQASALLGWWAAANPVPRQLIVGVIGLAIPGFTLGLIRRRETMRCVIRRDLAAHGPALARLVSEATLGVVAQSLAAAHYDVRELEPEVADWFFGERAVSLYAADAATVARIAEDLGDLDVPRALVSEGGRAAALAMSPAVRDIGQYARWPVEPIDT
jgi:hypothetical protein